MIAKVLCFDPEDGSGSYGWHAQAVPDPVRWKCGRCRRGVVVLMIDGIPDFRPACRVCGAKVEVFFDDGSRWFTAPAPPMPTTPIRSLE